MLPLEEILVTLKLPVESRFTMALFVSLLVGATFQLRPSVPLVVTGEPVTVKSDEGALRPTLVTVPLPFNVWQAHAEPFQTRI
jgi:hypothetical protein